MNQVRPQSAAMISRVSIEPGESSRLSEPERLSLFGITFHNVCLEEVFTQVDERIRRREPGYIVTPNVDHLCRLHKDESFRQAYAQSFLALADGVPVIWASRLVGKPIREKISGSDLVFWLSEHCAARGYSVFLFGGPEGVAEQAGHELEARYPGLRIAGTYCPPFGFEKNAEQTSEAIDRVRSAHADVCFVALGAPKQELWMWRHVEATGVPVSLGIGCSLEFVAGVTRRAPRAIQRIGLEWMWRMCQDPRRLAKRYLIDDRLFFLLVWREWRARDRARVTPDS